MYKQHFPMLNSIWPKIGLGPLFYSGIQFEDANIGIQCGQKKNEQQDNFAQPIMFIGGSRGKNTK